MSDTTTEILRWVVNPLGQVLTGPDAAARLAYVKIRAHWQVLLPQLLAWGGGKGVVPPEFKRQVEFWKTFQGDWESVTGKRDVQKLWAAAQDLQVAEGNAKRRGYVPPTGETVDADGNVTLTFNGPQPTVPKLVGVPHPSEATPALKVAGAVDAAVASLSKSLSDAYRDVVHWIYQENEPEVAMRLASAPGWPSDPGARLRAVRTLAATTGWTVDALRKNGEVRFLASGQQVFGSDPAPEFPTPAHAFAASTLARTWMLLPPPGTYKLRDTYTQGGAPAQTLASPVTQNVVLEGKDTGVLPALAVVGIAVVAIAAFAAAICVVAEMGYQVLDRQLARGSETGRMMELHKKALSVVADHRERELKEHREIAWTDSEMAVLNSLLKQQELIAAKNDQPLPTPFKDAIASIGKGAGAGLEDAGKGLRGFGEMLPWAAAAFGAVWLLASRH